MNGIESVQLTEFCQPYIVSYAYDYSERMVWKTIAPSTSSPIKTTTYVWDDYNSNAEHITTADTTNSIYNVWGLELSNSRQGADGLLAVHSGGTTSVSSAFPAFDGNGNVSELVGPSGAIRVHCEYSPFGAIIAQSGDLAVANPFRFSTKRQDEATGLLHYGYRDLDTEWGRWLSRVPTSSMYAHIDIESLRRLETRCPIA